MGRAIDFNRIADAAARMDYAAGNWCRTMWQRVSGGASASPSARTSTSRSQSEPVVTSQEQIELLSEMLHVSKERVAKGEVRIRKELITENQIIEVPVTRE